eukprot:scaffold2412_cov136-Skeletonema_marinoi.AAC.2
MNTAVYHDHMTLRGVCQSSSARTSLFFKSRDGVLLEIIRDFNHGDNLPLSRCSAESYPISQSQILRSELGVEEEPDEALALLGYP